MLTFFLFCFLLFAFFIVFMISSEFLAFLMTRVPFVPTYSSDVEFFVKKLGLSSKDVFYDLGSGNGKVVFLVEKLSKAKVKGFELGLWTILFSKIKKILTNSKAEFVHGSFFKANWSKATVIYGYLYPPLMGRVEEKFLNDCKPGSIAVIRDFPFPNLKPLGIHKMPKKHEIYIYKR